jgi:hypothetical protein
VGGVLVIEEQGVVLRARRLGMPEDNDRHNNSGDDNATLPLPPRAHRGMARRAEALVLPTWARRMHNHD